MPACRGYAPRERKALKIERVLLEFLSGKDSRQLRCLDLGCGDGAIVGHLADRFGQTIALDYAYERVHSAHREMLRGTIRFLQSDGTRLPFPDATMDVVICAQVYEHVASAEQLAEEVWRVLRSDGVCFFSGPNRLALIEDHYRLPFLSWLPQPVADLWVRLFRREARYDVSPRSYWQLRQLWCRFGIYDYTTAMLRFPEKYALESDLGKMTWARWLPVPLLRALMPLLPNYNWILVKPSS